MRYWRRFGGMKISRKRDALFDRVYIQTGLSLPGKFIYLSDLHFRDRPGPRRVLEEILRILKEEQPDYILFGGDLAGDAVDLEALREAVKSFAPISAIKLAVTGNWERGKSWLPLALWRDICAGGGIQLLDDAIYNDGKIFIYGASDRRAEDVPSPLPLSDPSLPALLLVHNPDLVVTLDRNDGALPEYDLAIAGHTHGGQYRLPILGSILTSSFYGRKFDRGVFRHVNDRTHMIVSAGLGELSCPFRLFCRREVLILT